MGLGLVLRVYILHLGGRGATFGIDDKCELMDVAISFEESEAGGGECLGLAFAEPMVAQREELR